MHAKTKLIAVLVAALGLSASSTFAATDSTQAGWSNWQTYEVSDTAAQLAKRGRGGRDDVIEHPTCDDRSDDLACVLAAKGRGGHDDVLPEDPQPEIEMLGAKGSGKNGTRTPGGSGCDGADDIADDHPACV
jgi:hypothetical protein